MNKQTAQEDGRWYEKVKQRKNQEADELHVGSEHHRPVRDQAVGVDHPWQAEDGHPGYPHTCDQGRPGSDADEEESKEETKSKENKQLDKENANADAQERDDQWDKDNTEPTKIQFSIV